MKKFVYTEGKSQVASPDYVEAVLSENVSDILSLIDYCEATINGLRNREVLKADGFPVKPVVRYENRYMDAARADINELFDKVIAYLTAASVAQQQPIAGTSRPVSQFKGTSLVDQDIARAEEDRVVRFTLKDKEEMIRGQIAKIKKVAEDMANFWQDENMEEYLRVIDATIQMVVEKTREYFPEDDKAL